MEYQEQSEAAEKLLTLVGARWFVLVILALLVFGMVSGDILTSSETLRRVGIIFIGALVATLIEWILIHSQGMTSVMGLRFVQGLHLLLIIIFISLLLWFSGVANPWAGALFLIPIIEAGMIVGPVGVFVVAILSVVTSWIFVSMIVGGYSLFESGIFVALMDSNVLEVFFPHALLLIVVFILSSIGSYAWRRERASMNHARQSAYSLLVELDEGVIVYDDRFVVRYINPAAERLLGVQRRDIIGHQAGRFAVVASPGVENLSKVLFTKLDGRGGQPIEISNPDRTAVVTQRSLFGPEGEPLGLVRLMRDVTQQQRVGKLKSEFISVAAHQLRTPLSGVRWAIEELKDDPALTGSQRIAVLQAGEAVNRTITLVNELLDIARIEEGRFDYEISSGQIEEIATDVVRELTAKSREKGVILEYTPPSSPLPALQIDKEKILMVIETLIDNAINYTPAEGHVLVEISQQDKEIVLKVEDTGVGIPLDQQDQIFTKFFRGDNVVRLQTEGSGLGLFIAQNVVRRHGGRIWFESEKGTGTRFFVALPIGGAKVSPSGEKR